MKPLCLLQLCRIGIIIYDWVDIPWLKAYYDFCFDHSYMSWKKTGVLGIVDCLLGNSGPFASRDWILPDLTIQGSIKLKSRLRTFPNTCYFSYATTSTRKIIGVTLPSSLLGIHPLLLLRALQMSQWRFPLDISPHYNRDEDRMENDSALNTISMTHPQFPTEHPSCFLQDDSQCQPLESGIWVLSIFMSSFLSSPFRLVELLKAALNRVPASSTCFPLD